MRHLLLILVLLGLCIPWGEVAAARLWSSGCEFQSDAPGTPTNNLEFTIEQNGLATQAIETTIKRSGIASCRSTGNNDGWALFLQGHSSSANLNPLYARFYLYIHTTPSTNTQVATWYDGIDMESSLVVTSSRTLILYDDNGAQAGTYATSLNTGTWYRIEMLYSTTGNQMEVRLDGTSVIGPVACTNCDGSNEFGIGVDNTIANPTGVFYYDDIAINDTSGSVQKSWPGAGSIVHMQPSGAGDTNNCSAGTFADIDEVTSDDDTSFCVLDADSGGDIIDVNLESAASAGIDVGSTINLVHVGGRERQVSAASASLQHRVMSASGGTIFTGTSYTHDDTTYLTNGDTVPRNYKLTSYTDPTTGLPWTVSGTNSLDNMQIGINCTDCNPDTRLTTLWALVEFVNNVTKLSNKGGRINVVGGKLKIAI